MGIAIGIPILPPAARGWTFHEYTYSIKECDTSWKKEGTFWSCYGNHQIDADFEEWVNVYGRDGRMYEWEYKPTGNINVGPPKDFLYLKFGG